MIAAIMIDDWKLPVFKKMLSESGYEFTEHKGLTSDMICLKVVYEDQGKLHKLVIKMNHKAAKMKVSLGKQNGTVH